MVTSDPGLTAVGDGLWTRALPGGLMLFGDLDIVTERAFRDAISAHGPLLLDVTQLNFLDSRGLAALFSLAEDPNVELSLRVRPRSLVDRVLQISGLDQVIRIERSAA
jgi:anti-anti-sigma factor